MKDEDKTREQLIKEKEELLKNVHELEAAYSEFRQIIERLRSFEKALETMQIGVTITDLEGNILYINPAEMDIHGYTAEDLKDKTIKIFAPAKKWDPLTKEKITTMKRWKRESINKRKDESIFPVQLMSDVIRDSNGKPQGIVTTCEDITDRKRIEIELKERVEQLEKFYEGAVHRETKIREMKEEIKRLKSELAEIKARS